MELGEGNVEVGAAQQGQVDRVPAVQDVHVLDKVKHSQQLGPGKGNSKLFILSKRPVKYNRNIFILSTGL